MTPAAMPWTDANTDEPDVLDLLVHCHDCHAFGAGPRYAARLAADLGATLTGLYVTPHIPPSPPPDTPPSIGPEFIGFVQGEIEQARQAHVAFGQMAEGAGVRSWHWQLAIGNLGNSLAATGNWNDLLILERRERAWPYAGEPITQALRSGLPCIVVRDAPTDFAEPRRVVIAWNGSVEALRAVHSALPILRRARHIHLFVAPVSVRTGTVICEPGFSLEAYLQQHGCSARTATMPHNQRSAEEAILIASAALGADLLVMGAYGRKQLADGDPRGATDFLLQQATLPLFLRH
jgi:nucleotide-binding universal stress UspA family protein